VPDGKPLGFVALQSLTQGPPDPDAALAAIRRIYFTTTRETVEHDLAHAVELLKSIPDETARDKAAVFMDGISQMRSDWSRQASRKASPVRKASGSKGRKQASPTRASRASATRPQGRKASK
jgi:hypothetical protein